MIELYRDGSYWRRWRWRRRAGNGKITATPGEPFFSKWNAKRAATKQFPGEEVKTIEGRER